MIEDSIVAEIRRFRNEHAEKYGHDLKRICKALREFEKVSGRKIVHRKPQLGIVGTVFVPKNPERVQ